MVHTLAITLLRHGITEDNRKNRFIGWSDVPLSEEGEQLLVHNCYPKPDYILCSDLLRCRQTLSNIYGHHPNVPVEYSDKWRELSFGQWERKSHEELLGNEAYEHWLQEWETAPIPDGESFTTFSDRLLLAWNDARELLVSSTISELVIITHGGPIRKLLTEVAPTYKPFWEWQVDYGSGYRFETTIDRLRRNERCISLQAVPFKENEAGCDS
ncbi:alpha-ribazole phosphatase [Bacillus mesophilus]|uniref:phosphoglycerate mutase (2,3-diphosphoglycerate-dependent) n=1 Tax=Bacillus mesophilus TaxID=1808955 RepID=A0A6M0Q4W1_9BACI|nr:histidine phosphatase family protein [Bacillus mesophilus]MBM7661189.1 alpha-ribazole phosphatase [Bacillus mesophilus]NEY71284.1 histidine phosphatase family protein [Bacillus mesophilus]